MKSALTVALIALIAPFTGAAAAPAQDFPVVDTGQVLCYDELYEIACPAEGQPFYGQDSQYDGHQPQFTVSGDGLTIHDQVTGLTWQQGPDTDMDGVVEYEDKMSFWDALDRPAALNAISYGGFDDWRLPTIKEMYSLIDFRGLDPSGDTSVLVPFIDTDIASCTVTCAAP